MQRALEEVVEVWVSCELAELAGYVGAEGQGLRREHVAELRCPVGEDDQVVDVEAAEEGRRVRGPARRRAWSPS
jgi:hypothetical protein